MKKEGICKSLDKPFSTHTVTRELESSSYGRWKVKKGLIETKKQINYIINGNMRVIIGDMNN